MNKKIKKAKPKTSGLKSQETLVNFILDKSGSMDTIKVSTISGFNEYLNTLKKDGNKYSFSLTLFDTMVSSVCLNVDIKSVKDLNNESYSPAGGTALYDAVCGTIENVKKTVKSSQKVITVIMTDGEENSSREFSQKDLREKIQELEKTGNWTFVFLGANQDSFANAGAMGIPTMNTVNYQSTNVGTRNAFQVTAMATSSLGSSNMKSTQMFYSATDQEKLSKDEPLNMNVSGSMGTITSSGVDPKISAHFSSLGKRGYEAKRKKILGEI